MPEHRTYKRLDENTLLIEWPEEISAHVSTRIAAFEHLLHAELGDFITESYPAYRSLAISYRPTKIGFDQLIRKLDALKGTPVDLPTSTRWELPVCYDEALAPDLKTLAETKKISASEAVTLHTSAVYKVFFYGFLPGFMYLGGLDSRLHCPRKSTPSGKIKAGSVAIGGQQTGIYPCDSPGGWHVIGNCPIVLFDVQNTPPCPIRPLDEIIFRPVTSEEYLDLELTISTGTYHLQRVYGQDDLS